MKDARINNVLTPKAQAMIDSARAHFATEAEVWAYVGGDIDWDGTPVNKHAEQDKSRRAG